jgi:molybdopterin-guanine dinucleotide biosynthesis protein A
VAGGDAVRFDRRPKGLETVGGERILDRLVKVMTAALGAPPLLVANSPDAPAWRPDLRVVRDLRAGAGALGGIHAAVVEAPAPVVCVAWDMPFVPAGLIEAVARTLHGHDAALPESEGPRRLEPLCAAYGEGCRRPIEDSLDAGDFRAVGFHPRITIGILPLAAVRRFGDPALLFFNINTADDLARANELWRQHGSSP